MNITFLGTGTSQGVPVIGCYCPVCQSLDFRDKRLRSSIAIKMDDQVTIIDTGPDFRQQVLRERIEQVDAIIFTHEHKDHTAGLDDIRGFNYLQQKHIPVYAHRRVIERLKIEFEYVFTSTYPGVPKIEINEISNQPFQVGNHSFLPIEVLHLKLPVFGYRVNNFTYITDAKYIDEQELHKAKGSRVLVINALQKEEHLSHLTLNQALQIIKTVQPEVAYLTHLGHRMGLHVDVEKQLPDNVRIAYDGLSIDI